MATSARSPRSWLPTTSSTIPPARARFAVTGTVIHHVTDHKLEQGWWNWDTLGLLQQLGAFPTEQPA